MNNLIFNIIENISYKRYTNIIWRETLNNLKLHINKNKKLPSHHSNNIKIRKLSKWLYLQYKKYKNKEGIMENEKFYKLWSEFIENYNIYFNLNNKN
jgi:hypothetical protein